MDLACLPSRLTSAPLPELATPFVSIIVPVFNHAAELSRLLHALAEQDYPLASFECIIIDNGSAPPIRPPEGLPFAVRLLREERPGSYASRNRGLREARGHILAFTDADCMPQRGWLSAAVTQIQSAREPLMVGGKVEVFCREGQPASTVEWHSAVNDLRQKRYVSQFHFAATANMITTRTVFERVGDFDAALFSGGDCEWGQRAWSQGVRQVYSPNAVVRHPARANWRALVARTCRITGGHYMLMCRTGRPAAAMLGLIARMALGSWQRAWHGSQLPTISCRLRVIALDLILRAIQVCELARLMCGGKPRRE